MYLCSVYLFNGTETWIIELSKIWLVLKIVCSGLLFSLLVTNTQMDYNLFIVR